LLDLFVVRQCQEPQACGCGQGRMETEKETYDAKPSEHRGFCRAGDRHQG
jgi:hypothetical protein